MKGVKLIAVLFAMVFLTTSGLAVAGTLDDVRAKGVIATGVNEGLPGFSKPDAKGVWRGLDVDTADAMIVRLSMPATDAIE